MLAWGGCLVKQSTASAVIACASLDFTADYRSAS